MDERRRLAVTSIAHCRRMRILNASWRAHHCRVIVCPLIHDKDFLFTL